MNRQTLIALDNAGLDPYTFRILVHLIRMDGVGPEGTSRIAQATNISQRKVVSSLKWLEEHLFIKVRRETRDEGSFRASTIKVQPDYYWITE